ncbi:hypothetical protein PXK00_10260 [Phaeobacter sp. QD34_3]|uniref:hypothetical protein n=1 Tax=unclassified Phaeobacter TaxID=2621772 RepID=UPI00237F2753|nr:MULTISPECIES: hypothetical protein [unclassified Phaeobacter]MDE4133497.1 hypothetical protein [Phaeobacter sp. QD34_3]MDE4137133.1 hypothetical protein [Phaeobacter sp. QD34_24]
MQNIQMERRQRGYRPPATGFQWAGARLEQALNRATIRSPLLRRLLAMAFLPIVWRLGLRINYSDDDFYVETPHSRMNRNAYGTVGGAALLANLELAAGTYLFMRSDGGHRIVCRNVSYRFMLPSTNGLHLKVDSLDPDLDALIASGTPFNATVKVNVYSRGSRQGETDRRIGRGELRFHLWPVAQDA